MSGVRLTPDPVSRQSAPERLEFFVKSFISRISTAVPVIVLSAEANASGGPAGYVDAKPLVMDVNTNRQAVEPPVIYGLPYFRLQAGSAAVVMDPVPGDIGLAVFAQRDCSALQPEAKSPVPPATRRAYSAADGFYIGGFLNAAPQTVIELKQDHSIAVTAQGGVTVRAPSVTVAEGDVIASGHSLIHHTHTGVHGETSEAH